MSLSPSRVPPESYHSPIPPSHSPVVLRQQVNSPIRFFGEVIHPCNSHTGLFDDTKRKELNGIIERGTFLIVLRSDTGEKLNTILSWFVLVVKQMGYGSELLKARFVVGGHRDRERDHAVHKATNLKQPSLWLILALASILGSDLYSIDINDAYLQFAADLRRKRFFKLHILKLNPDELLQSLKPIYGLTGAGNYWIEALKKHISEDLGMTATTRDLSLFFLTRGKLPCWSLWILCRR